MPQTRSTTIDTDAQEVLNHWALVDDARMEVARLARELVIDLSDYDTFRAIFGVSRLHEFPGTLDDAKEDLRAYAVKREHQLIDRLHTPEPVHQEAKTIAWSYIIAPDGAQINITAREGATAESVAMTVLALTGAFRVLEPLGFVSAKTRK
jgi:hypothetical protein